MNVNEYLDALEAQLHEMTGVVVAWSIRREVDSALGIGFIKGTITFIDNSRLELSEQLPPERQKFRLHYMDEHNRLIVRVEISNLQRQILYGTPDLGRPKTESARERIERLNPDVKVIPYTETLTAANIAAIVGEYDFVVECSDTFAVKFLVNDACVQKHRPFSHCGVLASRGQTMTYAPGHACLRCAFEPAPPGTAPTSGDVGILGAAAGMFGSLQAGEAIKYLTGSGKLLTNTLLYYDLRNSEFKKIRIKRKTKCPVCGKQKFR
jgi:molybdopterin/thiamine biosynthesis adenylyltransferase